MSGYMGTGGLHGKKADFWKTSGEKWYLGKWVVWREEKNF